MKPETKFRTGGAAHERDRACLKCGKLIRPVIGDYDYVECGLTNVKLSGVSIFQCDCGGAFAEIPAMQSLHILIATELLRKDSLLSGEEIRFLRKMTGLTQAELGKAIGVDSTRVSKWENDSSQSDQNDRLLRSYCLFGIFEQVTSPQDGSSVADQLAGSTFLQSMDVRRVFEGLRDETTGPKAIKVSRSPESSPSPYWKAHFIPTRDFDGTESGSNS